MKVVVETNVCIAANGRNTHASMKCQIASVDCLEKLVSARSRDQVLLDEQGLIFDEYKRHLNFNGQPGVGDVFFKHLHDHMHFADRVRLVAVTSVGDEARGFEELPQNSMDKSDRKFLATALVGKGRVFNALDEDWHEQANFIASLGVKVKQLCPEHGCPG